MEHFWFFLLLCPDPECSFWWGDTAEIKAHLSDVAARPSLRNRTIHSVNQCSSSVERQHWLCFLSMQSRQPAGVINSKRPRYRKTFDEHYKSSDEAEEQLPSTASQRCGALHHPLVVTPRRLFSGGACSGFRLKLRVQPEWIYLNKNISPSQ